MSGKLLNNPKTYDFSIMDSMKILAIGHDARHLGGSDALLKELVRVIF